MTQTAPVLSPGAPGDGCKIFARVGTSSTFLTHFCETSSQKETKGAVGLSFSLFLSLSLSLSFPVFRKKSRVGFYHLSSALERLTNVCLICISARISFCSFVAIVSRFSRFYPRKERRRESESDKRSLFG